MAWSPIIERLGGYQVWNSGIGVTSSVFKNCDSRDDLPLDVRYLLMWEIYSKTLQSSRAFSQIEFNDHDVYRKLVASVRPLRALKGHLIGKENDFCKGRS